MPASLDLNAPDGAFRTWATQSPLNGLAWNTPATDQPATCAAATGKGSLLLVRAGMEKPFEAVVNAESAILCLTATPHGFVTGNDAGEIHLTTAQGETTLLTTLPTSFVEHLTYNESSGSVVVAGGKSFWVIKLPAGEILHTGKVASTVGGLASSPIGRRLAVAHYNGATVFDLANFNNPPRTFEWKGSHLALTYSPNGKWLVSAMQEQALHLWRLADGMDLQMRGFPGKITQFSWSHDGKWLATTGGTGVPLWDFSSKDKGPAGQQARVVADSGAANLLVTSVAMHPKGPFMAIGFEDGLGLLSNYDTNNTILLKAPEEKESLSPLTHLAWSADGIHLAMGTESGEWMLVDFTRLT